MVELPVACERVLIVFAALKLLMVELKGLFIWLLLKKLLLLFFDCCTVLPANGPEGAGAAPLGWEALVAIVLGLFAGGI